ncbi:MAG: inositol monophosphatase [Bdellovibrionales bacterium]|nr:inositol monophosphatase [Bdellovibrionales bacterium]
MNFTELRSVAERVARQVGERMISVQKGAGPSDVRLKAPDDLVTEVDLWAEEQVREAVRLHFPDHLVIGEETSSELEIIHGKTLAEIASNGVCWIVDPIDGTANFVNQVPHSSISIAVTVDGDPVFGLVYHPYLDELFVAQKGRGAELNGASIRVGAKQKLAEAVMATGFPHDRAEGWPRYKHLHEALLTSSRKLRMLGSTAAELCWVACGRLDGFAEYHIKAWDVAAGVLIVREAGGAVASFLERDAPYSIFARSILAANNELLPQLLTAAEQAEAQHRAGM